ncbi:MAG: hypothetical protein ACYC1D_09665 [Acidimicrobiales bacterium]
MLLALVLLEPGEVDGARRSMQQVLLPGQRRVHAAKESPRRRRIGSTPWAASTASRPRRPVVCSPGERAHRPNYQALTRNTRLLTVRRARRVHFPPLLR